MLQPKVSIHSGVSSVFGVSLYVMRVRTYTLRS